MIVAWIFWWTGTGMGEVQLVTAWNVAGATYIGALLIDLVVVLWSQHRALAYLHLFGRTYIPDQGWVHDPKHTLQAD